MNAPARFPTTHWSLVARAGDGQLDAQREALGRLLDRYLPALVAHLVLGRSLPHDQAEDLVQDFVASKVIQRNLIGRANRDLGKFRTFLLTSLDRFLIDQVRAQRAKRRSPEGAAVRNIDDREHLLGGSEPTSDPGDVAWARQVISTAIERTRDECLSSDRADIWEIFACRLLGPMLEGSPPVDYEILVERFQLKSPSQAANLLVTGKRTFARVLRSVVAEYALTDDQIEEEIGELHSILAGTRP